ncbi:MAG: hypothetical protein AWU55_2348 [Halomonadaceae bacterium T82-2]|nr:MAG: hypothetical protein AWU55_2348 [Halomonadaceae bacterium T82-2]
MRRDLIQRLERLEQQGAASDDNAPSRTYQAMRNLGIEAPEPMLGEPRHEWLNRVPLEALESLLEERDAHA